VSSPGRDETLIWLAPVRSPKGREAGHPALTREAITRAAIELADADGLEAVSMRRIGAKLGSGATSLYWYVPSKSDLYELMFDEVMGEVSVAEGPSGDWRTELASLARATHAVLRRHRWSVLLGVQPGLGPKTRRWGQAALGALADREVDLATQVNILATLNNYVFGFIHREIAWEQVRRRSGLTDAAWVARLRRYARQADEQQPGIGDEIVARLELHDDASFDFGLELFLDGVAARLEPPSSRASRMPRARS
jgi:AcrR family transcriptional regulator